LIRIDFDDAKNLQYVAIEAIATYKTAQYVAIEAIATYKTAQYVINSV